MNIVLSTPQKAEQFAMLFQHVKAFTEHINIVFWPTYLYVQCMDSAHVSIMEMTLPAHWFDKYAYTLGTSDSTTVGLSSSVFYKILNSREKHQTIEIEYLVKDTDCLFVHMRSPCSTESASGGAKEFEKHFEIPLIALESDAMEIPAFDHQAEITISSYHFANMISQLKMFGDTMELQCSEEKIMLVSHSPENGKMFVEIKIDDVSCFLIEEGGDLSLAFSLGYLHNICLYHKIAKEVELKFSSEYPMQATYFLSPSLESDGDDSSKRARISFFLAPKINEE